MNKPKEFWICDYTFKIDEVEYTWPHEKRAKNTFIHVIEISALNEAIEKFKVGSDLTFERVVKALKNKGMIISGEMAADWLLTNREKIIGDKI